MEVQKSVRRGYDYVKANSKKQIQKDISLSIYSMLEVSFAGSGLLNCNIETDFHVGYDI